MASPSPADFETRFQAFAGPTNLDRCTRCGAPRSAHGADWSCPPGMPRGVWAIPMILGGLLTLVGLILLAVIAPDVTESVTPGTTASGSLGTIALLSGLTLLVTGEVLRRRLR